MPLSFKRTGVSDLSDSELLIFDFLFNKPCDSSLLHDDVFSIHANLPFGHGLTNIELDERIRKWLGLGLLKQRREDKVISMSPKGGKLWSAERLPRWEYYCYDSSYLEGHKSILNVESPRLSTAREFCENARRCRVYCFVDDEISIRRFASRRLLWWKTFKPIFRCTAIAEINFSWEVDWKGFNDGHYWRDVRELQKFF
jgi:hypothetical protein